MAPHANALPPDCLSRHCPRDTGGGRDLAGEDLLNRSLVTIPTEPGHPLEALWDEPAFPVAVAVLCHPHPLQGGSMTVPLMTQLANHLSQAGVAVLRFNFRGVGESGGTFAGGIGEVEDVTAAMAEADRRHPDADRRGLGGWSFGAATALQWTAAAGSSVPYVGVAPPIAGELTPPLPAPDELPAARRTFIIGDRDQYVTVEEMRAYAETINADMHVLAGSDHFFYFREEKVAEIFGRSLL